MESRRERPRVMGWLGVVAVLGNLLASVLCMAPAKAVAPVDDILGPLVLCTEHGPQTVPGNDTPDGSGGDQGDGRSSHCTACTLLAGLALLTAFIFAAIAFPACIFPAFRCSARTLADHLALGGIRSRAPPLCT
jgi:Protein of unknown function (DUF2946)